MKEKLGQKESNKVRANDNGQSETRSLKRKIQDIFEKGNLSESPLRMKQKSRLKLQYRFKTIPEHIQSAVFNRKIFTRAYQMKMAREKQENIQKDFINNKNQIQNRNNSLQLRQSQSSVHFELMRREFTDIGLYMQFQSSNNLLDRVEKKELQLLSNQDIRGSLQESPKQPTFASFSSNNLQGKYIFPFENFEVRYKEIHLQQLILDQEKAEKISFHASHINTNGDNTVICFTQSNDENFYAFALKNGILRVYDVSASKTYEINNHLNNPQNVSAATSLSILPDQKHLLIGQANGALGLQDFRNNKSIFLIKNFFKYSNNILSQNDIQLAILDFKVLFVDPKSEEIYLVAVNAIGDCILAKINKGILSNDVKIVFLMRYEIFPFTQISILDKALQNTYFPNKLNSIIIAITSPEKLFIIRVKPYKMKAKALFNFTEKQDTLVRNTKCCFTWGESTFKTQPELIFIVSFSDHIYTGLLTQKQEDQQPDKDSSGVSKKVKNDYQFEIKKRIRHITSILFMGTLFNDIFLICDFNGNIYMLNGKYLSPSFIRSISLNYLDTYKMFLPDLKVSPTIFYLSEQQMRAQTMVKMQITNEGQLHQDECDGQVVQSKLQQVCFSQSVSFSVRSSELYILCKKKNKNLVDSVQFTCISLISWRQTLEVLLEEGEYQNAMHFLHSIYHNNHNFAHNEMPQFAFKDLLVPQIERVALNYTQIILKQVKKAQQSSFVDDTDQGSDLETQSQSSSEKKEFYDADLSTEQDKVIFVIDFLMQCNQLDTIFFEIRAMCLKIFQSITFFIQSIEPFILEGKISSIPNEVLAEIISFYQQRGNLRVIQQILTSLDLANLDVAPLISLSMEKHLVTALIYLSTRSREPDFITPLIIFWNQFVKFLHQWEIQSSGETQSFVRITTQNPEDVEDVKDHQLQAEEKFAKEQIALSQVKDLLKIKTEYEGLRALWYFRLCIQQRLIDGEFINDEDYTNLVLSFETWISFPENINVCLHRWPEVLFDVLRTFFSEKPLKILNSNPRKVKQYAKEIDQENMKQVIFSFCSNRRNASPSEGLLRLIIKSTILVEQSFNNAILSISTKRILLNGKEDYSLSQANPTSGREFLDNDKSNEIQVQLTQQFSSSINLQESFVNYQFFTFVQDQRNDGGVIIIKQNNYFK